MIQRLMDALGSAELNAEAERQLARTKSMGLTTDWEGSRKEIDFAYLTSAVKKVFPPGGSIEIGVFEGGTSGLLICSCAPNAFHISIDPYGLPSQSYSLAEYRHWPMMRATALHLHQLANTCDVTYCHYLMDSMSFVKSNLFQHPGRFNLVHLDGDHSCDTVRAELGYFMQRLTPPTVFVLDDHDDHFPGVERALRPLRGQLVEIFHRMYNLPEYGAAGFSAWLHDVNTSAKQARETQIALSGSWLRPPRHPKAKGS